MASLADSDFTETSTLAPCKRCGELLQERVRFCPECGKDQSIADEPGDPSVAANSAPGGFVDRPPLALLSSPSPVLYDQVEEAMRQEVVPPPPQDAYSAFGVAASIGYVRPGALLHHEAQTAGNDRQVRWADRITPSRLVIGGMALLVAGLLFALGQEAFLDWQRDVGAQRAGRGVAQGSPQGGAPIAQGGQGAQAERGGFVEGPLASAPGSAARAAAAPQAPAPVAVAPIGAAAVAAAPPRAPAPVSAAAAIDAPRAVTVSDPSPLPEGPQAQIQPAALIEAPPAAVQATARPPAARQASEETTKNDCSEALAALALCRAK